MERREELIISRFFCEHIGVGHFSTPCRSHLPFTDSPPSMEEDTVPWEDQESCPQVMQPGQSATKSRFFPSLSFPFPSSPGKSFHKSLSDSAVLLR